MWVHRLEAGPAACSMQATLQVAQHLHNSAFQSTCWSATWVKLKTSRTLRISLALSQYVTGVHACYLYDAQSN